jgi:CelD/BcsL family acetyltransferase involved in cellulose biosynthesis
MLMSHGQLLEVRRGLPADYGCAAWDRLISRSLAPAGLMRPGLLLPLLRDRPEIELHSVKSGGELLLALPVARRPIPPVSTSWISPLTPGGAPHLDAEQGPAAIAALLDELGRPLLLNGIPAEGPFLDALRKSSAHLSVIETWQRAALRIAGGFAAWQESAIDRKHRKEYRRQRARLADQGDLRVKSLNPGADVRPFVNALLDLEAAGWKGRAGTAIKAQSGLAAAFREVCDGLHAAGALRFWQIALAGRPIAGLYAIVEGDCAWLGKIAYDETLARYSPGVQIILEATERLFAEPGLKLVDSCAIPSHPMIDHIWRDRIAMADVLVAGANTGPVQFTAIAAAEKLRRAARNSARAAYYRLSGKRRS